MTAHELQLMRVITSDTTADAADPMFAVLDDADKLYLIGEREIVQELHALLGEFLAGHVVPDPVSEDDPRFGGHISIAEAVDLAIASGYYVSRKRAANSINVAAGAGRIRGAVQSTTGRWSFPPRTFRHWLMRSQAETRGRPRKMSNYIHISLKTNEDAMVGSAGWNGYDEKDSIAAFAQQVEQEVITAYPGADVEVETCARQFGVNTDIADAEGAVHTIVTDTYGSFEWLRK